MNVICVTNRKLVDNEDFYSRIQKISCGEPEKIILREKDLSENEYEKMARKCYDICGQKNVDLSVNKFLTVAKNIGIGSVHLSISDFIEWRDELNHFDCVGVSVHSVEEAFKAQTFGANYIIAGHIFATDCKKGVPPRGLDFLQKVCQSVDIPVYAIGGINLRNAWLVKDTGVCGVCVMSLLMREKNPCEIICKIKAI